MAVEATYALWQSPEPRGGARGRQRDRSPSTPAAGGNTADFSLLLAGAAGVARPVTRRVILVQGR